MGNNIGEKLILFWINFCLKNEETVIKVTSFTFPFISFFIVVFILLNTAINLVNGLNN